MTSFRCLHPCMHACIMSFLRIGLYGDEANISENKFSPMKVLAIFLNIVHYRPREVRLSRYLLFSVRSSWLCGPVSLRPVLTEITRSLNLAYDGIDPRTGQALCKNGERFIVAEFRGDQDWHKQIWQHASRWTAKYICMRCLATSTGDVHNYTDLRDEPDWAATEHTLHNFINFELPRVPCCLAKGWYLP